MSQNSSMQIGHISTCACMEGDAQRKRPSSIGLGVLGSELKKQGFAVVGIDFKGCKDKPLVKTLWIDLTTRLEFWDIIREGNIEYVHFAPPCGTASAARNIRRRFIDPKPLRTAAHPDGLPDLQGTDRIRLDLANELYRFVARAI